MNARYALTLTLGAAVLIVSACNAPPVDRTKRKPHTAFRGLGYTRVIVTFNEANALARAASEQAAYLGSLEADEETLGKIRELEEDVIAYSDDLEWALANQQRVPNHRSYMDTLWSRYTKLFPEEKEFVASYRSGETRSYRFQRKYKLAYKENYGIQKTEPRWEDLEPVIRRFYEVDDTP